MTLTHRLRGRLGPILQTAAAATAAWYLAVLLLPDGRPSFAAIAAVICLGASHGERGSKAFQLIAGVVLGICVASAMVALIGAGSLQLGVMVVLAMSAAALLRGGEALTAEAAVSAILLVSLDPGTADGVFTFNRIAEALIGGGVSLAISSLLFPADPALDVGRAAQAVFGGLGGALERLAGALADGHADGAREALAAARALDPDVLAFGEALRDGREATRLSPRRWAAASALERYDASFAQIDFAVRDTRVLARHAVRLLRSGAEVPLQLPDAVSELARAVWALAAAYDDPAEAEVTHRHALQAAAFVAGDGHDVAGQVRSTAVDLRRAADLIGGAEPELEAPTEELLAPV